MVFLSLNYVPPKQKSYASHMLSIFVQHYSKTNSRVQSVTNVKV